MFYKGESRDALYWKYSSASFLCLYRFFLSYSFILGIVGLTIRPSLFWLLWLSSLLPSPSRLLPLPPAPGVFQSSSSEELSLIGLDTLGSGARSLLLETLLETTHDTTFDADAESSPICKCDATFISFTSMLEVYEDDVGLPDGLIFSYGSMLEYFLISDIWCRIFDKEKFSSLARVSKNFGRYLKSLLRIYLENSSLLWYIVEVS